MSTECRTSHAWDSSSVLCLIHGVPTDLEVGNVYEDRGKGRTGRGSLPHHPRQPANAITLVSLGCTHAGHVSGTRIRVPIGLLCTFRCSGRGRSSTTLPPSEPEVMLEVLPTMRAAQEHAGE